MAGGPSRVPFDYGEFDAVHSAEHVLTRRSGVIRSCGSGASQPALLYR
jgi:hypothetical protein